MQITDYWVVECINSLNNEQYLYTEWNYALDRDLPKLFTGQLPAEQHARDRSWIGSPIVYKARALRADEWRHVAAFRLDTDHWEMLPWVKYTWFRTSKVFEDHYPHASKVDPTKIAFVEDDTKGAADRITVMKPGRFLTKFFGDTLTPDQIAGFANEFIARTDKGELRIARTADEIEHVYLNGPSSCMSHAVDDYVGGVHPSRAYASPDLGVAYILRGGSITARSVVWPEKKRWVRIYGDHERLYNALSEIGYQEGRLDGAKLALIYNNNGDIVCPYLDSVGAVDIQSDHLLITSGGGYEAQNTDGTLEGGPTCDCCGASTRHESYNVYTGRYSEEYWCESCYENDSVYSEAEEISVQKSVATRLGNGNWVSDWYFSKHHGFTCDATDEAYLGDDAIIMEDGEVWCRDYFEDNGFTCAVTLDNYPLSEGFDHPELGLIHKDTDQAKEILEPELELELEAA